MEGLCTTIRKGRVHLQKADVYKGDTFIQPSHLRFNLWSAESVWSTQPVKSRVWRATSKNKKLKWGRLNLSPEVHVSFHCIESSDGNICIVHVLGRGMKPVLGFQSRPRLLKMSALLVIGLITDFPWCILGMIAHRPWTVRCCRDRGGRV